MQDKTAGAGRFFAAETRVASATEGRHGFRILGKPVPGERLGATF